MPPPARPPWQPGAVEADEQLASFAHGRAIVGVWIRRARWHGASADPGIGPTAVTIGGGAARRAAVRRRAAARRRGQQRTDRDRRRSALTDHRSGTP